MRRSQHRFVTPFVPPLEYGNADFGCPTKQVLRDNMDKKMKLNAAAFYREQPLH
jgi:hypothetical protein